MKVVTATLSLLAALMAQPALTQPALAQPADPLKDSIEALAERFEQAYRDCGLAPAFSASVEIRTHPGLISYSNARRAITISRHEELPPPFKAQLDAWAVVAGAPDGAALFRDIFQGLGPAHEMGHWLQHISRRIFTLDHWDAEVEANRIAFAFWSLEPEDAAGLPARVEGWLRAMEPLPSPVPEGRDAREYLSENYRAVASDAVAYGWYQAQFMRQAWAQRHEADFCDLARLNPSAPIEAFAAD